MTVALQLEAHSHPSGCLYHGTDGMPGLCSQVFSNGPFCNPVSHRESWECFWALVNVVPQPFWPWCCIKWCVCFQGDQAHFKGTYGIFIQVLAYFKLCLRLNTMKLSFYKNLSFTNFKASMFLLTFSELLLGSLYFFKLLFKELKETRIYPIRDTCYYHYLKKL